MCKKKIKLLDVFAGIGGFHIGVEQACQELGIEFECVGAIEFDKNAQQTYTNNFPNTSLLGMDVKGDITKMDLSKLPKHNLLCGGFPCQPFSRARHNRASSAGIHADEYDNRVDLFSYLCKILSIHKPTYFMFENVADLLKEVYDNGKTVIENIVKEIKKSGYDVQYMVLNTKDFGSPQVRKRLILVGKLKDNTIFTFKENFTTKKIKYIDDILEDKVDDKYLLEKLWKKIKNHKLPGNRYEAICKNYNSDKQKNKRPTSKIDKVSLSAHIIGDTPSGHSRQTDRIYNSLGLSPTLICTGVTNICIDKDNILRRLTPREYARIQCFPNSFIIPSKDNTAYKQFGNAICPSMVREVIKELLC